MNNIFSVSETKRSDSTSQHSQIQMNFTSYLFLTKIAMHAAIIVYTRLHLSDFVSYQTYGWVLLVHYVGRRLGEVEDPRC